MTSFTSPSDPQDRRLRRWVATFAGTFFGGAVLMFAILILVDPYDSGRFPSFGLHGVSDRNLRTSHVSRARDPQFDSAIFGSSTGTAIDPGNISPATGLHFTQLAFSHGDPPEILSVMAWFLDHRTRPGVLVLMVDDNWCSGDPNLPARYPFPFWLYGGDADYLANLLNWKSLDRVVWRVQLALGKRRPNDQAGFLPYRSDDPYRDGLNLTPEPSVREAAAPFVWIERLTRVLDRMPPGFSSVMVMTPAYQDFLPPPGSRLADRLDRCKRALATLAVRGPRGSFVDFRVDMPENRDRANFFDRIHYRPALARVIEAGIIAAVGQPRTAGR